MFSYKSRYRKKNKLREEEINNWHYRRSKYDNKIISEWGCEENFEMQNQIDIKER